MHHPVTLACLSALFAFGAALGCGHDSGKTEPESAAVATTPAPAVNEAASRDAAAPPPASSSASQPDVDAAHPPTGLSRVFFDDFESGNTNKWQQDDPTRRCRALTTSSDGKGPHGGNYQIECNWNGTVDWTDSRVFENLVGKFAVHTDTLVRSWVRYETDVDTAPNGAFGGKLARLTTTNYQDGDQIYWSADGDYSALAFVVAGGSPVGAAWFEAHWNDYQWHKIEVYMHPSLGDDGVTRLWVDGTLRVDRHAATIAKAGSVFDTLYVMSNWSGAEGCCTHDATNSVVWDDIEVFTDSDTGERAEGSLVDATAVARP